MTEQGVLKSVKRMGLVLDKEWDWDWAIEMVSDNVMVVAEVEA